MSHSLNSLKGLFRRLYKANIIGGIIGDPRSLEYSSCWHVSNLRGGPLRKYPPSSKIDNLEGAGC